MISEKEEKRAKGEFLFFFVLSESRNGSIFLVCACALKTPEKLLAVSQIRIEMRTLIIV
jgi:hypothetical protein